jgi:hypothetical protein
MDDAFSVAMQADSFAARASAHPARRLLLPKIATIIHNRHNINRTRVVRPFLHLQQEAAERIFAAYAEARQHSIAVFLDRGAPNEEQFDLLFTGPV